MTRITELLEFLNTSIHSTVRDIVEIGKGTLLYIRTCLQYAQEKIEFL